MNSLTCVIAFALLTTNLQGPAPEEKLPFLKADAKSAISELAKLVEARTQEAQKELLQRHWNLTAGRGTLSLVLETADRLVNSRLETTSTKADRIKRLEEYLEYTKFVEKHVTDGSESGKMPGTEVDRAKYYRLDAEIRLLREKGK